MLSDYTIMQNEEISPGSTTPFAFEDVEAGLKKMARGTAFDHMHMGAELLKWTRDRAREWLSYILTHALHHGFPPKGQENWVQTLFKGGDKNSVTNYRTMMLSSTLAKLFSIVLETKISTWAQEANKRLVEHAGFRKEHRIANHLVTLRVLMDESRLKGHSLLCCFLDLIKAFDTVSHGGLWERMQTLGVPQALRVGISQIL